MQNRLGKFVWRGALLAVGAALGYYWAMQHARAPTLATAPAAASSNRAHDADTSAERGAQLAWLGGCDDCHTPKLQDGSPDMTRRFMGYVAGSPQPPAIAGVVASNLESTAWRGPWGLSFSRNITPDPATGIGNWTLAQFISTIRTGKDPSNAAVLPPMPTPDFGKLPDADLTALYNFLMSVKPITNKIDGP